MDADWFKEVPVKVVIDTSVLRHERFNFSSEKMRTILAGIKNRDLEIISTEILREEFLKHYRSELAEDLKRLGNCAILPSIDKGAFENIRKQLRERNAEDAWKEFADSFKVKDVTVDVGWRSVFVDYFSGKPPFSNSKKKEFADAFSLKMFEAYKPRRLVIISKDGDFSNWAEGKEYVKVFEGLQEFTDEYVRFRDPEFVIKCDNAFMVVLTDINREFKLQFSETSYYDHNGFRTEIVDAEVINIQLVEKRLISIDKSDQRATYRVALTGEAMLAFSSAVAFYDSVDKELTTMGYNKNEDQVSFDLVAEIAIFDLADAPRFEVLETSFYADSYDVPESWETTPQYDL